MTERFVRRSFSLFPGASSPCDTRGICARPPFDFFTDFCRCRSWRVQRLRFTMLAHHPNAIPVGKASQEKFFEFSVKIVGSQGVRSGDRPANLLLSPFELTTSFHVSRPPPPHSQQLLHSHKRGFPPAFLG
jgi:hypothetical protein